MSLTLAERTFHNLMLKVSLRLFQKDITQHRKHHQKNSSHKNLLPQFVNNTSTQGIKEHLTDKIEKNYKYKISIGYICIKLKENSEK